MANQVSLNFDYNLEGYDVNNSDVLNIYLDGIALTLSNGLASAPQINNGTIFLSLVGTAGSEVQELLSNGGILTLTLESYDEGTSQEFQASLPPMEIASGNQTIPLNDVYGTWPGLTVSFFLPQSLETSIIINETLTRHAIDQYSYIPPLIELYNTTENDIDLCGYYLLVCPGEILSDYATETGTCSAINPLTQTPYVPIELSCGGDSDDEESIYNQCKSTCNSGFMTPSLTSKFLGKNTKISPDSYFTLIADESSYLISSYASVAHNNILNYSWLYAYYGYADYTVMRDFTALFIESGDYMMNYPKYVDTCWYCGSTQPFTPQAAVIPFTTNLSKNTYVLYDGNPSNGGNIVTRLKVDGTDTFADLLGVGYEYSPDIGFNADCDDFNLDNQEYFVQGKSLEFTKHLDDDVVDLQSEAEYWKLTDVLTNPSKEFKLTFLPDATSDCTNLTCYDVDPSGSPCVSCPQEATEFLNIMMLNMGQVMWDKNPWLDVGGIIKPSEMEIRFKNSAPMASDCIANYGTFGNQNHYSCNGDGYQPGSGFCPDEWILNCDGELGDWDVNTFPVDCNGNLCPEWDVGSFGPHPLNNPAEVYSLDECGECRQIYPDVDTDTNTSCQGCIGGGTDLGYGVFNQHQTVHSDDCGDDCPCIQYENTSSEIDNYDGKYFCRDPEDSTEYENYTACSVSCIDWDCYYEKEECHFFDIQPDGVNDYDTNICEYSTTFGLSVGDDIENNFWLTIGNNFPIDEVTNIQFTGVTITGAIDPPDGVSVELIDDQNIRIWTEDGQWLQTDCGDNWCHGLNPINKIKLGYTGTADDSSVTISSVTGVTFDIPGSPTAQSIELRNNTLTTDCNGTIGGSDENDECGVCGGDGYYTSCTCQPNTNICDASDCWGTDICGNCTNGSGTCDENPGSTTNHLNDNGCYNWNTYLDAYGTSVDGCVDCSGTIDGTSEFDTCYDCAGDNTDDCNSTGTCIDGGPNNGGSCNCDSNYYGEICDSLCACQNSSICNDGVSGDGSCICLHSDDSAGYYGRNYGSSLCNLEYDNCGVLDGQNLGLDCNGNCNDIPTFDGTVNHISDGNPNYLQILLNHDDWDIETVYDDEYGEISYPTIMQRLCDSALGNCGWQTSSNKRYIMINNSPNQNDISYDILINNGNCSELEENSQALCEEINNLTDGFTPYAYIVSNTTPSGTLHLHYNRNEDPRPWDNLNNISESINVKIIPRPSAILDDCNVCSGGNSGHVANSDKDCHGDCFGTAAIDDCGVCSGGNTGLTPNDDKDCNGDCFGSAVVDTCGVCSGGNTGHVANSDIDCNGDCFGTAELDDCDVCSGGNSGHVANSDKDCNGDCFGDAALDDCADCTGGNTGLVANYDKDCNGDCGGSAVIDTCGVCSGGNSGHVADSDIDCNGDCFGTAELDDCDVCSGGNSGHVANSDIDCTGTCFGDAVVDDCGVCSGGTSGHVSNSDKDCYGDCFGTAIIDDCDVCTEGNTGLVENYLQDCNGDCNGSAIVDDCGTCSGGNSGHVADSEKDCNGTCNGSAVIDDCGVCSGGDSGHVANSDQDCYGTCTSNLDISTTNCIDGNVGLGYNPSETACFALSTVDDCGVCSGGNGETPNGDKDCNGDCNGSAFLDDCGVCSGGNSGHVANSDKDCNGDCNGSAVIDDCGTCSGGNSGHVANSEKDCNGDCNGSAIIDDCEECTEGNTGLSENYLQDCNGDCNGTALLDDCNVCSGGNSGNVANSDKDCHGDCFGSAIIDDCGICTEGNTGLSENYLDLGCGCNENAPSGCNNECDSVLEDDECGICGGDGTDDTYGCCPANSPTYPNQNTSGQGPDCAGYCGGNNLTDNCGTCDSNSGNDCTQDCAGVWGGDAVVDDCGVCDGNNCSCVSCTCDDKCENGFQYTNGSSTCTNGICSECTYTETSCEGNPCVGNYCGDSGCTGDSFAGCPENQSCNDLGSNQYECICVSGTFDCNGICDGTGVEDCAGVCNGEAVIDECGVCGGNGISDVEDVFGGYNSCDCDGNINNGCGCSSETNNQFPTDGCDNTCGSTLEDDVCGVCGGDGYSDETNQCCGGEIGDCNGDCDGSAVLDDCGTCSGGNSGHVANSEKDCHGDCNGSAIVDDCGICTEGNTDLVENYLQDCNGDCNGTAVVDDCGTCSGGNSGHVANSEKDCNGDCNGSALVDDCGVCSGGNSGHVANSDKDCNGDCFGSAFLDDCNVCSGGNSDHVANSDKDCNGDCFGTAELDDCQVCSGGNTGHVANSDQDCDDTCFGNWNINLCGECTNGGSCLTPLCGCDQLCESHVIDDCGVCDGGNADKDCYGECNGTAAVDDCGVCAGGNTGNTPNIDKDCNGDCNGSAIVDDCGECTEGNTGQVENYLKDCNGDCSGTAVQDSLCPGNGCCGGNTGVICSFFMDNDADGYGGAYDCNQECGGTAIIDNCDVCSGGTTGHVADSDIDCTGLCFGTAVLDSCNVCSGGTSGHVADSDIDCNGDCFGSAFLDDCGTCSGGNSGHVANSEKDCHGDCNGLASIDDCGICTEGNTGLANNYLQDCNGDCNGTAVLDNCDVCSGGNTGHVADSDIDCNGDCFGTAYLDDCTSPICVGGNTGLEANDTCTDCNGDVNGTAEDDSCGVCSGGNSGHVADSDIDCNGDCFGSALEDTCGVCSGGNSGHVADSDKDCNGDCFGTAYVDNCSDCCGGNTGVDCQNWNGNGSPGYPNLLSNTLSCDCDSQLSYDCNNDCGGSAVEDDCGTCCGGNTGLDCVYENGEPYCGSEFEWNCPNGNQRWTCLSQGGFHSSQETCHNVCTNQYDGEECIHECEANNGTCSVNDADGPFECTYSNNNCCDCAGSANGGNSLDDCGTCRNPSCGTDGTWPECYVNNPCPNGEWPNNLDWNTSCLGCEGCPNTGTVIDPCDICDGNNTDCGEIYFDLSTYSYTIDDYGQYVSVDVYATSRNTVGKLDIPFEYQVPAYYLEYHEAVTGVAEIVDFTLSSTFIDAGFNAYYSGWFGDYPDNLLQIRDGELSAFSSTKVGTAKFKLAEDKVIHWIFFDVRADRKPTFYSMDDEAYGDILTNNADAIQLIFGCNDPHGGVASSFSDSYQSYQYWGVNYSDCTYDDNDGDAMNYQYQSNTGMCTMYACNEFSHKTYCTDGGTTGDNCCCSYPTLTLNNLTYEDVDYPIATHNADGIGIMSLTSGTTYKDTDDFRLDWTSSGWDDGYDITTYVDDKFRAFLVKQDGMEIIHSEIVDEDQPSETLFSTSLLGDKNTLSTGAYTWYLTWPAYDLSGNATTSPSSGDVKISDYIAFVVDRPGCTRQQDSYGNQSNNYNSVSSEDHGICSDDSSACIVGVDVCPNSGTCISRTCTFRDIYYNSWICDNGADPTPLYFGNEPDCVSWCTEHKGETNCVQLTNTQLCYEDELDNKCDNDSDGNYGVCNGVDRYIWYDDSNDHDGVGCINTLTYVCPDKNHYWHIGEPPGYGWLYGGTESSPSDSINNIDGISIWNIPNYNSHLYYYNNDGNNDVVYLDGLESGEACECTSKYHCTDTGGGYIEQSYISSDCDSECENECVKISYVQDSCDVCQPTWDELTDGLVAHYPLDLDYSELYGSDISISGNLVFSDGHVTMEDHQAAGGSAGQYFGSNTINNIRTWAFWAKASLYCGGDTSYSYQCSSNGDPCGDSGQHSCSWNTQTILSTKSRFTGDTPEDSSLGESNQVNISYGGFQFNSDNNGGWASTKSVKSTGAGAIYQDGGWHHYVAILKDNGAINFYIDGTNKTKCSDFEYGSTCGTGTYSPIEFKSQGWLGIGTGAGNGWGATYYGSVDDIKLYNRDLSPEEIVELYNAGRPNYSELVYDSRNGCGYCQSEYSGGFDTTLLNEEVLWINYDSPTDCNGTCFDLTDPTSGPFTNGYGAYLDDCDICSEGNSGHTANSQIDSCGKCMTSTGTNNIGEDLYICSNDCGGGVYVDPANGSDPCNNVCNGFCERISSTCNDLPTGPAGTTWTDLYTWYWNYSCMECDNQLNSGAYKDDCFYCCGTSDAITVGGFLDNCHVGENDGTMTGPSTGCLGYCQYQADWNYETISILDDTGTCCYESQMAHMFPDIDYQYGVMDYVGELGFCEDPTCGSQSACEDVNQCNSTWYWTNPIKFCDDGREYIVYSGGSSLKCDTIQENPAVYPNVNADSCDAWTTQPGRLASESGFTYYKVTDLCDGWIDDCGSCWSNDQYINNYNEVWNSAMDCRGTVSSCSDGNSWAIDDCGFCIYPNCIEGLIPSYWDGLVNTLNACDNGYYPSEQKWNSLCTGCTDINADDNDTCYDSSGQLIECTISCNNDTHQITLDSFVDDNDDDTYNNWGISFHSNTGYCTTETNFSNCCCHYILSEPSPQKIDWDGDGNIDEDDKVNDRYIHGYIQVGEPSSVIEPIILDWVYLGPIENTTFNIYRNDSVTPEDPSSVSWVSVTGTPINPADVLHPNETFGHYRFADNLMYPIYGDGSEPFVEEQRFFTYYIEVLNVNPDLKSTIVGYVDGGNSSPLPSELEASPNNYTLQTDVDTHLAVNVETSSPSIWITSPTYTDVVNITYTPFDNITLSIEYDDLVYIPGADSDFNQFKGIISDTFGNEIFSSVFDIDNTFGTLDWNITSNIWQNVIETGYYKISFEYPDASGNYLTYDYDEDGVDDNYQLYIQVVLGCLGNYSEILNSTCNCYNCYDLCGECITEEPDGGWEEDSPVPSACYDDGFYNVNASVDYCTDEYGVITDIKCNYPSDPVCGAFGFCNGSCTYPLGGCMDSGSERGGACITPTATECVDDTQCESNQVCGYDNFCHTECRVPGMHADCAFDGSECIKAPTTYENNQGYYGSVTPGTAGDYYYICSHDMHDGSPTICNNSEDNQTCIDACTSSGGENCESSICGNFATIEDNSCQYYGCLDVDANNYVCNISPYPVGCYIDAWNSNVPDSCTFNFQVNLEYGLEVDGTNWILPNGEFTDKLSLGVENNEDNPWIVVLPYPSVQPDGATEQGGETQYLELRVIGEDSNQYQVWYPTESSAGFSIVESLGVEGSGWEVPVGFDIVEDDLEVQNLQYCSDNTSQDCVTDDDCTGTCIRLMQKIVIPDYNHLNPISTDPYKFSLTLVNPEQTSNSVTKDLWIKFINNDYTPVLDVSVGYNQLNIDIATGDGENVQGTMPLKAYDLDNEEFTLSFETISSTHEDQSINLLTYVPEVTTITNNDPNNLFNLVVQSPEVIGFYTARGTLKQDVSNTMVNSWGCELDSIGNDHGDGEYLFDMPCPGDCIYYSEGWEIGNSGNGYPTCAGHDQCTEAGKGQCVPIVRPLHGEIETYLDFAVNVYDTSGPSGFLLMTPVPSFGISRDTWQFQFVGEDGRTHIGGDESSYSYGSGVGLGTITYEYGVIEESVTHPYVCEAVEGEYSSVQCDVVENDNAICIAAGNNFGNWDSTACINNPIYDPSNACVGVDQQKQLKFGSSISEYAYNQIVAEYGLAGDLTENEFLDFYNDESGLQFELTNMDGSDPPEDPEGTRSVNGVIYQCYKYISTEFSENWETDVEQYTDVISNPNYGGWLPKNAYNPIKNPSGDPNDTIWKYQLEIQDEYGNELYKKTWQDWINEDTLLPSYWDCSDSDNDGNNDYCWYSGPGGTPTTYYPPPNSNMAVSNVESIVKNVVRFKFSEEGVYKVIGRAWDLHYNEDPYQGTNSGSLEYELNVEPVIPIKQSVPQKYLPWQGINYPENIWVDNYRGNDYLDFINKSTRRKLGCFWEKDNEFLTWTEIAENQYDDNINKSVIVSTQTYDDACSSQVEKEAMNNTTLEIKNAVISRNYGNDNYSNLILNYHSNTYYDNEYKQGALINPIDIIDQSVFMEDIGGGWRFKEFTYLDMDIYIENLDFVPHQIEWTNGCNLGTSGCGGITVSLMPEVGFWEIGWNHIKADLHYGVGHQSQDINPNNMGRWEIYRTGCDGGYDITFVPDVDVRTPLSLLGNRSTPFNYWDEDLNKDEFDENKAPVELQFYFYKRELKKVCQDTNNSCYTDSECSDDLKCVDVMFEDLPIIPFSNPSDTFIGFVDWGDGSPIEFDEKPHRIGDNHQDTVVSHVYEKSGLFNITGYMFVASMEFDSEDQDWKEIGVATTSTFPGYKKFSVFVYLNRDPKDSSEFEAMGGTGYNYIPYETSGSYKKSSPVIGGTTKESVYVKSIKRELGYINETPINIKFPYYQDRLDAEYALAQADEKYLNSEISRYTGSLVPEGITTILDSEGLTDITQEVEKESNFSGFYSGSVDADGEFNTNTISLIHKGNYKNHGELGQSLGNVDISEPRVFGEGSTDMWQHLGFQDYEAGIPDNPRYWKNIAPKNYTMKDRGGIGVENYIKTKSNKVSDWSKWPFYTDASSWNQLQNPPIQSSKKMSGERVNVFEGVTANAQSSRIWDFYYPYSWEEGDNLTFSILLKSDTPLSVATKFSIRSNVVDEDTHQNPDGSNIIVDDVPLSPLGGISWDEDSANQYCIDAGYAYIVSYEGYHTGCETISIYACTDNNEEQIPCSVYGDVVPGEYCGDETLICGDDGLCHHYYPEDCNEDINIDSTTGEYCESFDNENDCDITYCTWITYEPVCSGGENSDTDGYGIDCSLLDVDECGETNEDIGYGEGDCHWVDNSEYNSCEVSIDAPSWIGNCSELQGENYTCNSVVDSTPNCVHNYYKYNIENGEWDILQNVNQEAMLISTITCTHDDILDDDYGSQSKTIGLDNQWNNFTWNVTAHEGTENGGFDLELIGIPNKKIYAVYPSFVHGQSVDQDNIDEQSDQSWFGTHPDTPGENPYYYPVLPKINQYGQFDENLGMMGGKNSQQFLGYICELGMPDESEYYNENGYFDNQETCLTATSCTVNSVLCIEYYQTDVSLNNVPFGSHNRKWNEKDEQALVNKKQIDNSYNIEMSLKVSEVNNEAIEDKSGAGRLGLTTGDYRVGYDKDTKEPAKNPERIDVTVSNNRKRGPV